MPGTRLPTPRSHLGRTCPRVLLSGHPIHFDTTTDPAAIRLAERLIQEGLCAPLTDVLSSGYTGLVPTETF